MNNKWRNSRCDSLGYVQWGYGSSQMREQAAVDLYQEWERANRSKAEPKQAKQAEPKQAKQAEPKPDRRIILALG
jgi:hypothetical protein